MKTTLALSSLLLLAACGGKPLPDDSFEAESAAGKADTLPATIKLAGSLRYGESGSVRYSKTPRYRAFKFAGNKGDVVAVDVTSTVGDPVTWLLDAAFNVVDFNDDADQTTTNSHLSTTLTGDGNYYVVLRDYNLGTHYFNVSIDHQ